MSSRHWSHSFLLSLLVAAPPLCAQGVTAQLSGTVASKAGEALGNATVTIRNVETGLTRTLQTDGSGRFRAASLPVGPYLVSVTKAGFQTIANLKVNLNLGDAAPLNVRLASEAGTTVEVVAISSAVDSERAASAVLMSPDSLTHLPIKGRGFTDLAELTPQVTKSIRGSIAIGGQRGVNTSVNIDGGDYNEPFFAGNIGGSESQAPYTVSVEAIREFQVITDGASAEFGRMGGGYVNAITKNGTNELKGSLFYYTRPESLVAKDHQNGLAPLDFTNRQFGGSVGGPIIKDKLFYFLAFDVQRESRSTGFIWGGSPSAYATLGLDATAANVSADPYNNDAALVDRLGNYAKPADADTYFLRLDWNLHQDHTLQLRVNRSKFEGMDRGTNPPTSFYTSYDNTSTDVVNTLSIVGQWNWTLGAHWINETRINYVKDELPRSPRSGVPAAAAVPAVELPRLGGVTNFYGGHQFTREFETKRTQVTEILTFITPEWQFRGGFDYNKTDIAEVFAGRSNGEYRFGSLADFRAGNWNRFRQYMGLGGRTAREAGTFAEEETEWAAFLQADWRPNPAWKVALGLRYDRQEHPDFPILDYSNPMAAVMPVTAKVPQDSQVSPRLSATWTPEADQGRTVIRLNAGSYVSRSPSVFLYQVYTNNGIRAAVYSFGAAQAAAAASLGVGRGAGFNAQSPASINLSLFNPSILTVRPDLYTYGGEFRNPVTKRVNLEGERGFWDGWVFGLKFSFAETKHLERLTDLNLPTPTPNAQGRLVFGARPNPNYGGLFAYLSDAESRYSAVTLSAKYHKEGSPFQAQVFYTYAKEKDNDSNERSFSGYDTQNPQRLMDDWGWSANDRRNVVTGYVSFLEQRWTKIQSGFNLRYLSGQPYNLNNGSDLSGDGGFANDRPVGVARNSKREASRTIVDLKLSRDWHFGKVLFTVSGEVFNLFNHVDRYERVSFGGTDASPTFTSFPRALSLPREVQLGARLAF